MKHEAKKAIKELKKAGWKKEKGGGRRNRKAQYDKDENKRKETKRIKEK